MTSCLAVVPSMSIQDCKRYQTDMLVSAAAKHLHVYQESNNYDLNLGAFPLIIRDPPYSTPGSPPPWRSADYGFC